MVRTVDISFPAPLLARDGHDIESLKLSRVATSESTHSSSSAVTSRSYRSNRQQEKRHGGHHASGGDWIELFYDLFFAASLSAFSRTREIASKRDLLDLTAFFTILWWTWTSQTIFDVRHARYAKSEKPLKLVQLLIMIGYGVFEGELSLFRVAPPGESMYASTLTSKTPMHPRHHSGPRTSAIAIISLFVISRFQLGAQYLRIAYRQRDTKSFLEQVKNTSLINAALPVIAATFWIASFFVLNDGAGETDVFAARTGLWIAGILVEMVGTFAMRLHQRSGLEKTHLTERFGSLTIILLGEGVIKLVSVLRDISSGLGFETKSGVAIITSIFSFYLIWALYFDNFTLHDRIKSTWAYPWAYTHYAFHLTMVLTLDAITSLLLFTNLFGGLHSLIQARTESSILEDLMGAHNPITSPSGSNPNLANHSVTMMTSSMTNTSNLLPLTLGKLSFEYDFLTTTMSRNGTELSQANYDYVFMQLFQKLFESYNVQVSKHYLDLIHETSPDDIDEALLSRAVKTLLTQFIVSAQFFLISGGLIFITMIPLMVWQRRLQPSNWSRFLPTGSRLVVGALLLGFGAFTDSESQRLSQVLVGGGLIPVFMGAAATICLLDFMVVRYLQFL